MLHKLICRTQTFFVQNLITINDNGIIHGAAKRQTGLVHGFNLLRHAEGAGIDDICVKVTLIKGQCVGLATNGAAIKVNLGFKYAFIVRHQLAIGVAIFDTNRLSDPHDATRHGQFANFSALDQFDKRLGAAIHNRHFSRINFNNRIINAQARKSRH